MQKNTTPKLKLSLMSVGLASSLVMASPAIHASEKDPIAHTPHKVEQLENKCDFLAYLDTNIKQYAENYNENYEKISEESPRISEKYDGDMRRKYSIYTQGYIESIEDYEYLISFLIAEKKATVKELSGYMNGRLCQPYKQYVDNPEEFKKKLTSNPLFRNISLFHLKGYPSILETNYLLSKESEKSPNKKRTYK